SPPTLGTGMMGMRPLSWPTSSEGQNVHSMSFNVAARIRIGAADPGADLVGLRRDDVSRLRCTSRWQDDRESPSEHSVPPKLLQLVDRSPEPVTVHCTIVGAQRVTRFQRQPFLALEPQWGVRQRDAAQRGMINPL